MKGRLFSGAVLLLCALIISVAALAAPVSAATGAAFDSSVFSGDTGYEYHESDGTWLYYKGIVFSGIDTRSVQLYLQADGSDAALRIRLLVLVTDAGQTAVSDLGTPKAISFSFSDQSAARVGLPDQYRNPACASADLCRNGEALCRLLSGSDLLSFGISFEGTADTLFYELTEENVSLMNRTVGLIGGRLAESGIFDCRVAGKALSDNPDEIVIDAPAPEPTEGPMPEPATEPSQEPAPEAAAPAETEPAAQSFRNLSSGMVVTMGVYEQNDDPDGQPEPVEWQVLTVEPKTGRALLLSVCGLEAVSYGKAGDQEEYTRTGLSWESAEIREWLNGDFLQSVFTEAEKERILETEITTTDKSGKHITNDRLFLLSGAEAKQYMKKPKNMACTATEHAKNRLSTEDGAFSEEGLCQWWLRDLVKVPFFKQGQLAAWSGNEGGYVYEDHALLRFNKREGCPVYRSDFCVVRPAMWIQLD